MTYKITKRLDLSLTYRYLNVSEPEFEARYKAKYGKKPTYHAACAYASMMIAGPSLVEDRRRQMARPSSPRAT